MDQQPDSLQERFNKLPYHKVCYQQGHARMSIEFTPSVNDDEIQTERSKDIFGLTPFHILALSTRPSLAVLQKVIDGTSLSPNGILAFNQREESTPLRHAIESQTPGALAFIKAMRLCCMHLLKREQQIWGWKHGSRIFFDQSTHLKEVTQANEKGGFMRFWLAQTIWTRGSHFTVGAGSMKVQNGGRWPESRWSSGLLL